jgi:predicted peptidase
MNHPDLFAALGPISGGGNASGMVKIKAIPQYVTHGDDDRTVNVNSSRTMVEAGKKAGALLDWSGHLPARRVANMDVVITLRYE